ncbi:DNA-binding protein [Oribacterium sp. C9]|uniref:helix-turn-helix domain-containing protein n=1 Tax=Oribacterium sp. C9 TaxID=1943579 RepID=UPI0009D38548|nr:helix-turn-helix transcriptional regulator [Oribacterium sp. C9]OON87462.1 DNA-binding protein [Oribacterium sp. C9]
MGLDRCALGERIRVFRQKKGLTQNILSEKVEISPSYMSYIENGVKSMSLETFIDIANTLDATADDLLQDSLKNTVIIMNHNFTSVIFDCSDGELRILLDIITSTKESLRANKHLLVRRIR